MPTMTESRRRRVAGERARTRPAPPTHPQQEAREPRAGTRLWALPVLVALLILVLVGVGLLVVLQRRAAAVDQASGEAVAAARTAATKVLSYDYRHLDADFAAGRALTTEPFSDQYAKTTSEAVQQVASKTKATVQAQVASVGVERASADEVVVLLFVDQTTTSSRLERPQVDQNRVEMTMTKLGDRWLVSQVRGL